MGYMIEDPVQRTYKKADAIEKFRNLPIALAFLLMVYTLRMYNVTLKGHTINLKEYT